MFATLKAFRFWILKSASIKPRSRRRLKEVSGIFDSSKPTALPGRSGAHATGAFVFTTMTRSYSGGGDGESAGLSLAGERFGSTSLTIPVAGQSFLGFRATNERRDSFPSGVGSASFV